MDQDAKPVLVESFHGEGRGPELLNVSWSKTGRILKAIDFQNPDESTPKHLLFSGVQVLMFTPEEVINFQTLNPGWRKSSPAAILCLGKSAWLKSFAPEHLEKCLHFQVLFYDELLDIICESIEAKEGHYTAQ